MKRNDRVLRCLAFALALCFCLSGAVGAVTLGMNATEAQNSYFNFFAFREGRARVVENKFYTDHYGFVDTSGKEVVPCIYLDATDFSEGLAAVKESTSGLYGYIDPAGKVVVPFQFTSARGFSNGFAYVEQNGGKYFINTAGVIVMDVSSYTYVESFSGGMAEAERIGGHGFINTAGKEVIPCIYQNTVAFSDEGIGFADGIAMDANGTTLFSASYDMIFPYADQMAKVQKNGKIGYINTNGTEVIPCAYSTKSQNFSEGLCYIESDNSKAYVDREGNLVLNVSAYDYCGYFKDGFALCEKDGHVAYMDEAGNLSDFLYDDAVELDSGFGLAQKGDALYVVTPRALLDNENTPDEWAKEDVSKAISFGLVPGGLQSGYRQQISREDFCDLVVTMLQQHEECTRDELLQANKVSIQLGAFGDTNDEMVLTAYALGVVSGRSAGVFDPDSSITRQEAAVMLSNAMKVMGLKANQAEVYYADAAQIAPWAEGQVHIVTNSGIMSGIGDDQFDPLGTYTRQQAIVTILRLYRK